MASRIKAYLEGARCAEHGGNTGLCPYDKQAAPTQRKTWMRGFHAEDPRHFSILLDHTRP